jgi:hypothetical protein
MPNKSKAIPQRKTSFTYFLVLKLSKYLKLNTIVYFPVLLSGLVFLLGSLIAIKVFPKGAPLTFTGAFFFIMFFIASLSGFIQISTEEVPGFFFRLKGKAAIFFGILWISVFWFMGFWAIWYYLL